MHVFGIALLFGLGIMSVARWVERPMMRLRDKVSISVYPLLEVSIGVGLAWAVDFNLWKLWHVPMRADWVAVTLTGVALGGIAHFFSELLATFSGLGRKLHDEAETIEHPGELQRVA
jgi:drug/metabolite transporter (DMT)-like permease